MGGKQEYKNMRNYFTNRDENNKPYERIVEYEDDNDDEDYDEDDEE